MYLDKESYERAGLVGKPDGVKGKRATKPRWGTVFTWIASNSWLIPDIVVEINLRLPSMLHGKKGFDRIVYACKNVLNTPVTWLICDLSTQAPKPDPIDIHFPTKFVVQPQVSTCIDVILPPLKPPTYDTASGYEADFEDFAVETLEWLSLVSLNSSRISPDDKVDSFLSRYVVPGEASTRSKLVKVTWQGFFSSSWAHRLLVEALQVAASDSWFSLSLVGFESGWSGDTKDCTILKPPNAPNEYVTWEVGRQ